MALRNERRLVTLALLSSVGLGLAVGYRACTAARGVDASRDGARVRVAETGSLYRFAGTSVDEPGRAKPPEASLSLTASDGTGLALAALDAKGIIQGPLGFTELRLVFENPDDRVLEGTFRITLPAGAAISRFAMRIGDTFQEGEVVEKQAARQAYEDFLHRRQDPALLEQAAGNEFSARVFPIPARGRKEIIVSYSQEITPETPYKLALRGLPAIGKLDAVVSATGDDAPLLGQLHSERQAPDRDLLVEPARMPKGDGVKAGELVLVRARPAAEAGVDAFGAGIVLVDTSASRALGFEAQITLVERTLAGLGDAKIVVAAFDQGIDVVYEGPAKGFAATGPQKLRERQAFGASDVRAALLWAGDRARTLGAKRVLLVSDGVATAGETEPSKIREAALGLAKLGVERLDAIAVGGIRDDDGLESLCTAGLPRDGVVIDGARGADAAIRRLGQATRTVDVTIEGADWQWPQKLRGLQPGDEALVYARMLPGKTPKLSFVERGEKKTAPDPVLTEIDRPLLERAWVSAKIAQLVQHPTEGKSPYEITQEIVSLSTTHRVLSPHTALLVLETENDYARYKIDRRALADILTVDGTRLVRRRRTDAPVVADRPIVSPVPTTMGAIERDAPGRGRSGAPAPVEANAEGARKGGSSLGKKDSPSDASKREASSDGKSAPGGGGAVRAMRDEAAPAAASPPPPLASAYAAAEAPAAQAAPPAAAAKMARPAELAGDARADGFGSGAGGLRLGTPALRSPTTAPPAKRRAVSDHDQPVREQEKKQKAASTAPKRTPEPVVVALPPEAPRPGPPPSPPAPIKPTFGPYEGPLAEIMRSLDAGDKTTALTKALAFRAAAPGDVLALLGLGEVLEAMGELRSAARAYGSIIDLFPGRADLRRMAGERLERLERDKARWAHSLAADSFQKAVEQRPDHPSSHRLLSFARLRAGDVRGAFDAIEAGAARTYPSGRFLGVDRILKEDAGLIGAAWIKEEPGRRDEIVDRLGVLGATVADRPSLRFVLLWETDNNDVDFHIHDSKGGHAYYGSKALPSGGSLYADVTTGYGPECFAVDKDVTGRAAPYKLEAHYFSRGPMGYGMGKLEIIDHDGKGTLSFEERPYVIMTDRAYVQLGTYPGSADGGRALDDREGSRQPALPRP